MFPGVAQQAEKPSSSMVEFQNFVSGIPGLPAEMRALGAGGEPTAEDIEKNMEAVRFDKKVLVKDVQVRTWDLSDEKQVDDYRETYLKLYAKVSENKILIKQMDKQFINDGERSRWILHMEWIEYDLKVTDYQMKRDKDDAPGAPVQYRPANGH